MLRPASRSRLKLRSSIIRKRKSVQRNVLLNVNSQNANAHSQSILCQQKECIRIEQYIYIYIYIYLDPFPWHSVWRGRFFEFFTSRLNVGLLGCQRQQAGLIQRHKTTPRLSPRCLAACRWYHSALHCSLASSRSQ
jgi:hypothetical protein